MKPKHFVLPLMVVFTFFFGSLNAQCFKNVVYGINQSQSAIELTFDDDYNLVIINLENARLKGNSVFENSITIKNVTKGRSYIVYRDLQPSKYLIQLVTENCKWVIGGIEGIIIKDEDEK